MRIRTGSERPKETNVPSPFIRSIVALASTALTANAAMSATEPPSDERVAEVIVAHQDKIAGLIEGGMDPVQAVFESAEGATQDLAIEEMSGLQLLRLTINALATDPAIAARVFERLDQLKDTEGSESLAARSALVMLALTGGRPGVTPQSITAEMGAILDSESLGEALRDGGVEPLGFLMQATIPPQALGAYRGRLERLFGLVGEDTHPQTAVFLAAAWELLEPLGVDEELRQSSRRALVASMKAGRDAVLADPIYDDAVVEQLDYTVGALESPFMRGELVGNPAPDIEFIWSSGGDLESLNDLRGKVVIIDFWATWCGPCIVTFPQIRTLVEHYEGFDVRVIGLTSLQGFHAQPGGGQINTQGDPEQEFELMRGFMAGQGMTWPVVFSETNVYNPDYGVRGIPHVTIVAPDGTVRHNGLHPAEPFEGKTQKIDAILREFSLPVPE
ncbi:MAG: TlpA disulfide reductase family protein [Planctomycetota bacterium]